jgi:hypothetical protein
MSASAGCYLLGKWRIIEADTWDCDYLDLVQPAYIVFGKNGRGEFAFGAIEATLELEYAPAHRILQLDPASMKAMKFQAPAPRSSLKTTTPSSKSSYPSTMQTMPS